MVMRKWGESFLKSGLPLEHLTLVTLRSLGWYCRPHLEYERPNREKVTTWFELDLEATSPVLNKTGSLTLLIECKYHDASRFWFFLPHERYRWHFDDRVLNPMPLQVLQSPRADSFLSLAPTSVWGVVVSEGGEKQENAAQIAAEQLANGFVPFALSHGFAYMLDPQSYDPRNFIPQPSTVIPMIVTNARIYRLKPSVTDLDTIRKATTPEEIADELQWTWCYFEPSMALIDQNAVAVEEHIGNEGRLIHRYPGVEERARMFDDRPNWIVVANVQALPNVVTTLHEQFAKLKLRPMRTLLEARTRPSSRRRKRAGGRPTTASS
jgi:hypothetical protein